MKTLQEIQNEVIKENDCEEWDYIHRLQSTYVDEVAKRYAQEALKEAAEKARTKTNNERTSIVVDKESITNIELR